MLFFRRFVGVGDEDAAVAKTARVGGVGDLLQFGAGERGNLGSRLGNGPRFNGLNSHLPPLVHWDRQDVFHSIELQEGIDIVIVSLGEHRFGCIGFLAGSQLLDHLGDEVLILQVCRDSERFWSFSLRLHFRRFRHLGKQGRQRFVLEILQVPNHGCPMLQRLPIRLRLATKKFARKLTRKLSLAYSRWTHKYE
jgi:hypothetical protein